MTTVKPPPTGNPVVDESGKATIPWLEFVDRLYRGDLGADWTPAATNLTITGAAPTITGRVYQISRALSVFMINIIPGTDTSSTAGTTYFSGFPLSMAGDGFCIAVSGLLGGGSGMVDRASGRIYPPSWSAVTVSLTIIGIVEAG